MSNDPGFVPSSWNDELAFAHSSPQSRLVILSRGGKFASLTSPTTGREWLLQPRLALPALRYGAEFVGAEMCGWDEMAPSIVATTSQAAAIPDHGEVWSQRWATVGGDHQGLRQVVRGRAVPFSLERTVRVTGPGEYLLDYAATTPSESPVQMLWAGHPQFLVSSDDVLQIDADVAESVLTHGAGGGDPSGPVLAALATGQSRKRWLRLWPGSARASIVGAEGASVTLEWDAAELPFLGLWEDNVDYAPAPVVAIEPSNGWYDDLALAAGRGSCLQLSAVRPAHWSLRVSLGHR